ncbi:MAG: M16 family metallopeptidase [Planctomycetota bacterium]|jgi:predicted Zn-dependent peptidase
MEFCQAKLDNGLTIVAEVNPHAASMAAGFFVLTGSRDETKEINGVSHFLEHMVFKGTQRRNAFDVSREFDELGANYNAFTSEENTVYYGAVLPEFQMRLLDLLGDMLRPALREEDFELEKNVIIDEIAMYQDVPKFRVYDKLMGTHFSPHPLGNSILGTNDSIGGMQLEQMKTYFERRYSPGNITVVGAGNIDFNAFTDKISQTCSNWKPFDVLRETPRADGSRGTELLQDQKVMREHIGLMSPGPSRQDTQRFAAELLATIVGDTSGSRLFYALVDPAIADEATTAFAPMDGEGAFITFVSTDAERASEGLGIVRKEFEKFVKDGPTDNEIRAAKNKIASDATLKGELPMGRLTAVGFDWMYRQEYISLKEQLDKLFAVTRDEVHEVARAYDLTRATVVGLGPAKSL